MEDQKVLEEAAADKRPKFGNRHLTNEDDVFQFNAWDDVPLDPETLGQVVRTIEANASAKVAEEKATELEEKAGDYWNTFYNQHENKFFKDRHWLFTEFPELVPESADQLEQPRPQKTILELGCGVGNTVFPLLEMDPSLFVYCCDFSAKAIELVKATAATSAHGHRLCPFVFDLTSPDWAAAGVPFAPGSLDVVTMIFVLSAIDPTHHRRIVAQITPYLKPRTGTILFRDYAYCDLAQVRFKRGRCIKDNFYVRGDGTRSYFFEEAEVDAIFSQSGGLRKVDLHLDRRLQVNRANKKKMYRIWIQAKYQNSGAVSARDS